MDKEIRFKVLMDGVKKNVGAPPDLRIDEFIHEFVTELNILEEDAQGRLIKWRLEDQTTGRTLSQGNSLAEAGVENGHHLSLVPITFAGYFSESARILLSSGDKVPIGKITPNDLILSYDPESGSYVMNQVTRIHRENHSPQIILNNRVITTPDQRFLLADRSCKRADDLVKGTALLKFPFRGVEVKTIEIKNALMSMVGLTLQYPMCFVVDGFIAREFWGKRASNSKQTDEIEVFLSYSVADKNEAASLANMLERGNITFFLAEKNIEPGQQWENTIKERLKGCCNFWILVTPNSLRSEWVVTEWAVAWALNKKIVPILCRCKPEDLPKRLQAYQCIDLHNVETAIQMLQHEKKKV